MVGFRKSGHICFSDRAQQMGLYWETVDWRMIENNSWLGWCLASISITYWLGYATNATMMQTCSYHLAT